MNSVFIRKSFFAFCVLSVFTVFIVACSDKDDDVIQPQELTMTFGTFTIIEDACGQSFTRDNVTLMLQSSYNLEEDCAQYSEDCAFANDDDRLWIAWGRAVLDISKLGSIEKITVTIEDYCGKDCSKVILLDKDGQTITVRGNTTTSKPETITFETNLGKVHSIAVSGCESLVESIVIDYKS